MARFAQKRGQRGSQKWLQLAVEHEAPSLNQPIAERLGRSPSDLSWLSPAPDDDFAEYRDQAFLDRTGVVLKERQLSSFWPNRGPQWDGLGRSNRGDVILVEAKAHIGELVSPPSQASEKSLTQIRAALDETRRHLGVSGGADWAGRFYQYTNRLAHLYLLRTINKLPAWMVFVHFVGDSDMNGPRTRHEWEGAIKVAHLLLGLTEHHRLAKYVIDVFIDISSIDEVESKPKRL